VWPGSSENTPPINLGVFSRLRPVTSQNSADPDPVVLVDVDPGDADGLAIASADHPPSP
jgi:hypothetical protein